MLNRLFTVSSFANVLGGAILFVTWASNWATDPERHVPIIVCQIGGAMMIQGLYSAGYAFGWWKAWGDLSAGALLAGQLISGCVGLGMLIVGIAHNASQPDGEMAPDISLENQRPAQYVFSRHVEQKLTEIQENKARSKQATAA